MSKISGKNLVIPTLRALWKRSVALATDYAHRYHSDLFLKTEVNTIALLALFSLFILLVVGISSYYLYYDVMSAMSEAISEALMANTPPSTIGENVIEKLEGFQTRNITILSIIVIALTIIAGYIVARVVLTPTRSALGFQKQFIGNIAHELRTPLSNIKTTSEVALLDPSIPSETRAHFASTVEELNRISDIINNLLSLTVSIRPERVEFRDEDIGPIIESALRKLHTLASQKQLEVAARMSERRIVWGNASALEQIVTNILKNAILYTRKNGHIAVTVEPVYPDFIEITVRDSGIGIPRKDLFRVFEPYYRTDSSRNRARGGSGLGLTIVSELIKLHHGKITIRSIEGRGTTVAILLPAGKQSPNMQAAPEKGRENMSEIEVDFSHGNGHTRNPST